MREIWEHRCVSAEDVPRQWAVRGSTLIVETRSPGKIDETVTTLTPIDETVTTLTAMDISTGDVKWQRNTAPVGINQAIVVDEDLLVLLHAGQRPLVQGYDMATGAALWTHPLTAEPRGVTMLGPDIVVVAGSTIRKLDRDGRLIGRATIPGSLLATVAVTDDGDIITANGRGKRNVLRLSGDSLDVHWDVRIPGEGWAYKQAPLVEQGTIYFHSYSQWAMAIDVATGDVRWRKKKAAGRDGVVLRGLDGDALWGTDALSRVRRRDGKVVWTTPRVITATGAGDPSRVMIARRADVPYAYAPDERIDVRIDVLDATTGEAVDGVDLTEVTRDWVPGDMSDRLFAVVDGKLVSGLESGRVRVFQLDI